MTIPAIKNSAPILIKASRVLERMPVSTAASNAITPNKVSSVMTTHQGETRPSPRCRRVENKIGKKYKKKNGLVQAPVRKIITLIKMSPISSSTIVARWG